MLNELLNVTSSADTSNFSGAVTKIPSVKLAPVTVRLWDGEAAKTSAEKDVVEEAAVIDGLLEAVPVSLTSSIRIDVALVPGVTKRIFKPSL